MEKEVDNKLAFLDVLINNNPLNLQTSVVCKKTFTLWNKLVPGSIKSTCSHAHIYGLVFSNKR